MVVYLLNTPPTKNLTLAGFSAVCLLYDKTKICSFTLSSAHLQPILKPSGLFLLHSLMSSIRSYDIRKQNSQLNDISVEALTANHIFYRRYPNRWSCIRERYLRDAASEFFGTMLLLMWVYVPSLNTLFLLTSASRCGAGVDCQVTLSSKSKFDVLGLSS